MALNIPSITTLSTPPSKADPTNFAQRADTFLGELPTLATETNAAIVELNKITSGLDQTEPIAAWEDTPTSYDFPDVVAGSDGRTYRCVDTAVVGEDPTLDDGTYWLRLTNKFATTEQATTGTATDVVMSPATNKAVLESPPPIGATTENTVKATTINATSTTDATSTTAGGAMTVAGGLAVAKKAYFGDTINLKGEGNNPFYESSAGRIRKFSRSVQINIGTRLRFNFKITNPVSATLHPVYLNTTLVAQRSGQGDSVTAQGTFHAVQKAFTFQIFTDAIYDLSSDTRLLQTFANTDVKIAFAGSYEFDLIFEGPTTPSANAHSGIVETEIICNFPIHLEGVFINEAIP